MLAEDLLTYKSNQYSQNGEDGIIQAIFERIGNGTKTFCEFGAWDGIWLSNCRKLILEGWKGVMIEGSPIRFKSLQANYRDNPSVICVNREVDTESNSLDHILHEYKIESLDLLSVDIDGLDYWIFQSLALLPRVLCIEVNAGHSPNDKAIFNKDVARSNVGQPLEVFNQLADQKGYGLVGYTGNAFYVQNSLIEKFGLPRLSSRRAYESFIHHLPHSDKEWLYLVNNGIVSPYRRFENPYARREALGISRWRAAFLASTRRARFAALAGPRYIAARANRLMRRQ